MTRSTSAMSGAISARAAAVLLAEVKVSDQSEGFEIIGSLFAP